MFFGSRRLLKPLLSVAVGSGEPPGPRRFVELRTADCRPSGSEASPLGRPSAGSGLLDTITGAISMARHAAAARSARDTTTAEELLDDAMAKLDDVFGIVFDGPDMSQEQVRLLALLPEDDLEAIVGYAEECAENVRDYARLAREALRAKCPEESQGAPAIVR